MKRALGTSLLILAAAGTDGLAAQDFNWRGSLGRSQSVEIKGINGSIRAVPATGNEVRVSAVKSGRRSDPGEVDVEVLQHDGGVTICAVYPSARRNEPNECRPGSGGRMNTRDNDVKVEFEVAVPEGVRVVARNVNGNIGATSLRSDFVAITVNGQVDVSTSGLVEAKTVNGSIRAEMGRLDWPDEIEFETVNGSITLTLAGQPDTEVRASTVNGSISTDFPLTVQGRFGPKRVTGTIGNGGRTLALSTVNGSIQLRRR